MIRNIGLIFVLLCIALVSFGCGHDRTNDTSKKNSVKIRTGLGGEIGAASQIADLQGEDTCHMIVYKFDSDLKKVGTAEPHEMTDIADILTKVHDAPLPKKNGTFFNPLFKQILKDATLSTSPVFVIVLTDGGIDDPAALRRSGVIKQLAACKRIKSFCVGPIHDQCRLDLEHRLKGFGPRLHVFNPIEFERVQDNLQTDQNKFGTERTVILAFDDSRSIDRS